MPNLLIKNTQVSTLDLTPVRDVFNNLVVLRPKGSPGDCREISEETAELDTITRVHKIGWISVTPKIEGVVKVVAADAIAAAPSPAEVAVAVVDVATPTEAPAVVVDVPPEQAEAAVETIAEAYSASQDAPAVAAPILPAKGNRNQRK